MKLTISQKIDLAQVGATEEDQRKMCLLARKIQHCTRVRLRYEAYKIRRALADERVLIRQRNAS
jgi:hypothetical protein